MSAPQAPCPVCEYWDDHSPTCIISRLKNLGAEGRQQHRRAALLITLLGAGAAMTLTDLSDTTGFDLWHVRSAVKDLFVEGLAYPTFDQPGAVVLTTAPHVHQECVKAAELLGIVVGQPRPPLSPMLGQEQLELSL